jgi:hypothetical protein
MLYGLTMAGCLAGGAAMIPAASAGAKSAVNTFTFGGHYHGTLKLIDPAKNCEIDISPGHIDVFLTLSGKIPGLISKKATFRDTEAKNGTYVQEKPTRDGDPLGIDTDTSTGIASQSGKEVFGTTTGSVNLKEESDGINPSNADFVHNKFTLVGSWSCPASTATS